MCTSGYRDCNVPARSVARWYQYGWATALFPTALPNLRESVQGVNNSTLETVVAGLP